MPLPCGGNYVFCDTFQHVSFSENTMFYSYETPDFPVFRFRVTNSPASLKWTVI